MGKTTSADDARANAEAAIAAAKAKTEPAPEVVKPVADDQGPEAVEFATGGEVTPGNVPFVGGTRNGVLVVGADPVGGVVPGFGDGTYGGMGPEAAPFNGLRVRSNQNLNLDGQFLTPDNEYDMPNTPEVQAAIAVGALTVIEDEDLPDEGE